MDVKDACEQAYQNGYHDGIKSKLEYNSFLQKRCVALRNECDELETKCHQLQKERDALLSDVSDYQGSICCYCKNIVRAKGVEPSCRVFGDFPTTNGLPLHCGRFEWRGVPDEN